MEYASAVKKKSARIKLKMWLEMQLIASSNRALNFFGKMPNKVKNSFLNTGKYAQGVHDAICTREIYYKDRLPTTPYEMVTVKKPIVRRFRVFWCPTIFKK